MRRKGEERNKERKGGRTGWRDGCREEGEEEGGKVQRLGLAQGSLFAKVMRSRTSPVDWR